MKTSITMKPSLKKQSGQFLRFTLGLAALMLSLSGFGSGVWTNTGSLNTARFFQTANLLPNGLVLVAGGYASGYLASAELYYPATGTWSNTGSLNTARTFSQAALLPNGLVLVAGGQSFSPLTTSTAELYNPATGTWSYTGSLNTPREYHTLTLLPNGLVLASGGLNDNTSVLAPNAELYYAATGTWSNTGSLNTPRGGPSATLLTNGLVLVAGGATASGVIASAELYNPATGTWSNTGSLNTAREWHTATLLTNGLVLVAGGDNGANTLTNAELYYPATGTWSNTGSLNTAREIHTATLLAGGLVLAAGGDGQWPGTGSFRNPGALTSVEVYNPATGIWTNTVSLLTSCYGQSATLLTDGNVLVAGGRSTNAVLTTSAEIYEVLQPCTPYPATATATVTNGFVVDANVTDGGCGYTNAPEVLILGGGGTGATATAVVSNGMVVGLTITDAGIDYTNTPTVYIYFPTSVVTQPQSLLVNAYSNASFSVTAVGTEPLSYQWLLDGANLPGATSSILTISSVEQTNLGTYAVLVTNAFASVASSNATLSMYPFLAAPFGGLDTYWGYTNTLSVTAWGTGPLYYQWFDNGVAIDNATNPTLSFIGIQPTNGGLYTVVVTSPFGSVTNAPEQVVVNPAGVAFGGIYPSVIIRGVVGYSYAIQDNANLADTNSWVTLTNLTLTQPIQLWVDTNTDAALPANPLRFYRVLPGP
jgi:N-acetylneuraminic acid mutarotase